MHIRSLVKVMVLLQEKWVTYLEAAHSVAIICTPLALGIFTGPVFIKKKKLHKKAVLTFFCSHFVLC